MTEPTLDVGLACKLKQARNRNEIPDNADFDWLAQGDNLLKVRRVRLGHAEIVVSDGVIDCDADPYVPDGWLVLPDDEQLPNRVCGTLRWDKEAQKDALYLDKGQSNLIGGNELRKALARQPVLNANVLDYLLAHPHFIPEEWKGRVVFFWGTIYCFRRGNRLSVFLHRNRLGVRCLHWFRGRWHGLFHLLDNNWHDNGPAALSASQAL